LGALLSALRQSRREGLHPFSGSRNSLKQLAVEQLLPRRQRPQVDGDRHRLVPSALPRVSRPRLCRDPVGRNLPEKPVRIAEGHFAAAPHRRQVGRRATSQIGQF